MDLEYCKDRLIAAGVSFSQGLSAEEISAIEQGHDFRFPPDLKDFLSTRFRFPKAGLTGDGLRPRSLVNA